MKISEIVDVKSDSSNSSPLWLSNSSCISFGSDIIDLPISLKRKQKALKKSISLGNISENETDSPSSCSDSTAPQLPFKEINKKYKFLIKQIIIN